MSALKGEGNFTFSFYTDSGYGTGALFLKCLDYVFSSGMLSLAVNTAKAAAHADFVLYIDSLHNLFLLYVVYGNRLPYTYDNIPNGPCQYLFGLI
jgi:hypothetical protein